MKLVDRGVVVCSVVLLSLVWESKCDDTHAELLSERARQEEKAEVQKQQQQQQQQQTQTLSGGGENNGQNENPDQQTDSNR